MCARLGCLSFLSPAQLSKGCCAVHPALGVHLLQVVANGHLDEVQELCKLNSTASSEGLASTSEFMDFYPKFKFAMFA